MFSPWTPRMKMEPRMGMQAWGQRQQQRPTTATCPEPVNEPPAVP